MKKIRNFLGQFTMALAVLFFSQASGQVSKTIGQIIHEQDSTFQLAIDSVGLEQMLELECGGLTHYLKWKENMLAKVGPHGKEGDFDVWLKQAFDNPLPLYAGSGPWVELGPFQQPNGSLKEGAALGINGIGPVNFISFDPNYQTTQLVFTGGWYSGLWYSRDAGQTWQNGGMDKVAPLTSAAHCVSSHLDDNVWFVCTGQGDGLFNNGPWQSARSSGIYRTIDGGETWELIADDQSYLFADSDFYEHNEYKPFQIKKLLIDYSTGPSNLTIYATHSGGISRCTNAMSAFPQWTSVYDWSTGLSESEQAHSECWYPNMELDGLGNTAAWAYDLMWVPTENNEPCCQKMLATVSKVCNSNEYEFGNEILGPADLEAGWHYSSAILKSEAIGSQPVGSTGTWSEIDIPASLKDRHRISIGMSKANPNFLWAWGMDIVNGENGVSRCDFSNQDWDGPLTWNENIVDAEQWSTGGGAFSYSSHTYVADGLTVSPLNANLIYFPTGEGYGVKRFDETQNPNSYIYRAKNNTPVRVFHDDVESIEFSPNGEELWLATHGGIYVYDLTSSLSEHHENRWEIRNQGLGIAEVDGMSNPTKEKGRILIGLFHQGSMTLKEYPNLLTNTDWYQVGEGDGNMTWTSNDDSNISYFTDQEVKKRNNNGWVTATGNTIICGSIQYKQLELNYFDNNVVYSQGIIGSMGMTNGQFLRHDDTGGHCTSSAGWIQISNFSQTDVKVRRVFSSFANENLIWGNIDFPADQGFQIGLCNKANAQVAADAQNAWVMLPVPQNSQSTFNAIGVQSDLRDDNVFYVLTTYYNPPWATGEVVNRFLKYRFLGSGSDNQLSEFDFSNFTGSTSGLFEITDLTKNFPRIGGQSFYMNRGTDDVFVGTPVGVLHATISELESEENPWKLFGDNLPHCELKYMTASLAADRLRVGAHGRGVWEIPLPCEKLEEEVIISSGETQTWERFYRFRQDVVVKNNAQLTIKGDVYMGAECRIIVEPGGKLIIDGGTVTNACGELWLGIEVWGNDAVVQNSNNQGVVELKNGAVIENAHAGIWVRQNDDECQYIEGSGGGIVRARDSEIRNCYVGVEFAPYSWIVNGNPATNQSYFNNMTFKQTQPLNNDILFKAHVILNEVHKVPFRGCRFKDEVPQNSEYASYYPEGWKNMGIGIDARSSTFIVDRKCDGSLDPSGTCSGNWIPSEFENLAYGIKATDGLGIHPFAVRHSQFRDNVTDIYGSGMDIGPSIALNSFDKKAITVNTISPWKVTGVVLEETEGYEVEENTFNGDTSQNPSGQQLVGAAFVHTGPVANECYKNTFNGVTVAAHAQGVNGVYSQGNTAFEGLQFRCNQFGQTADNELADIQVTDESRVAVSQGANFGPDVAGNTFSHLCPGGTGASDIVLGVNSVGNEYSMTYYYGATAPEEPLCIPQEGVEKIEVQGGFNNCPSELSFTETKIQAAQVKSTLTPILDDVVALYNGLRDGGNPSGLVAYINNANHSSIEVRNEMMNCGPYISLAAWQAAFTRTPAMDPWHLAQVLFLNTPLHPDVKRMMNYYNFDPYYEELVLNGQNGGITHMQIMESDISALTGQIRGAEQDYMRLAVLWEEDTTRWDEVMTFIGTDAHRQRLKAAIHMARSEYTQADNVLGGLPQNQSKGGVLDILLAAEQANQFCPKFTIGQRNDLEYLAADVDAPGHSTARALLLQETGAEYDTELYFPLNPRNLMLKKPRSEIPLFMKIHPNPTRDLVYVTFRMPAGDVRAELEITDNSGKTVYKEDVSQNKGLVELALKQIGSGTYICTLRFDGQVVDSQKLSVLK